MSNLRVSEAEVKAVEAPEGTRTWNPVRHSEVIDALDSAVEEYGLAIKNKSYSLTSNGNKLFGTWSIDSGNPDRDWAFGFRNSIDKTMAVGMTAGTNILVCSNMCFSGEYVEFRKHTAGLNADTLTWMANKAIEVTVQKSIEFDAWHQGLKEIELTSEQAKCFAFDCMQNGVFPPSKFKTYVDACMEEYQLSKSRSLYTYHAGVTRLHRDSSLFNLAGSTKKLVGLCDDYKALAA